MPIPYPLHSKGYGGSGGSSYGGSGGSGLVGYSTIPSTSYIPGVLSSSTLFFGRNDYSSGRSPMSYGGSGMGSSLGFSSYAMPSSPYAHVSPYGVTSSPSYGYGGYTPSSSSGKSYYTSLPTISEHSSGNAGSGNKRRNLRTYIPVLPLPSSAGNRPALYSSSGVKTLFTEDIDVTTPRKTAKPGEISRDRPSGPGQAYGTIRRGRTVIRLETKKLKENPYLKDAESNGTGRWSRKEKEKVVESVPEPIASTVAAPPAAAPSTTSNGCTEVPVVPAPVENGKDKDSEAAQQLAKDYSHVTKWYEEEIRKPQKKEKNAGDKFREKYMVHSRKNKYAGYRRPTLSDIRAEKAVVLKEIEERLKKLTNGAETLPAGVELSEEAKAEAEKLEKDKERLARLDKKMAKRFSRALRKVEKQAGDAETSDDESIIERQATMKGPRRSSSGTIKVPTDPVNITDVQGLRLTRKVTKRFFFPEEASSVVQPEIIESLVPAEPEDLFEKKILAQRSTLKMRSTQQKKVYNINQRKSSASDLEIPCDLNCGDNKLCDGEGKEESLPEILEEVGSPVNKQPMVNGNHNPITPNSSGKKKKYVKKVGDPPAKRVPGNILQPLVIPPKDDASILDSPEEDIKAPEVNKNKKPIFGKLNGFLQQQEGLLKHPLIKNNLKPAFIKPLQKNGVQKFEKQNAVVGQMPGKKTEIEVASKIKDMNNKEVVTAKSMSEIAVTETAAAISDKKVAPVPPKWQEKVPAKAENKAGPVVPTPKVQEKVVPPEIKAEPAAAPKEIAKPVPNGLINKAGALVPKPEADKLPDKALNKSPLIAKLQPKLALDNKSSSFDNNATPKLKLDNKSSSLNGKDQDASNKKPEPATKTTNEQNTGEDKSKGLNKKFQKPTPVEEKVVPKTKEESSKPVVDEKTVLGTPEKVEKDGKGKIEDVKGKFAGIKVTELAQPKPPQPIKKEIAPIKEAGGLKVDALSPIKKVDDSSKKVEEKVQPDIKSPPKVPEPTKKTDANESSKPPAKQDLVPVKVQEKPAPITPKESEADKIQKPEEKKKPIPAFLKLEDKLKSNGKSPPPSPKGKFQLPPKEKPSPVVLKPEDKLRTEVKSPPPSPKNKFAPTPKEKVEVKASEPKPKAQDESVGKNLLSSPSPKSDKADDKSESLSSPPKPAQEKQQPTSPVEDESSAKPKVIKEKETKPFQKNNIQAPASPAPKKDPSPVPSPSLPLTNGHLSPPSSVPKGKCTNSTEQPTVPTTGKQQPSKSPQSSETTQKEMAGNKTSTQAKVENLGVSTETLTNGPEKGKKKADNLNASEPLSITQDAATTQMNKLGNLSSSTPAVAHDETSSEKSSELAVVDEKDKTINDAAITKNDELVDEGDKASLPNPRIQRLIRKSVKRVSTHSSGGSSLSSTSSTLTAKSGSGSSTSSSTDGPRRVPSPPIDDDSDEERITLDKICPAKTRPKYRKYEIEDFQFLKVLGKGSFGKVLLAELKGSDSYFAIKCLKKDVVLEDDDVECTMIERKVLLMGSKHPYLCHLFCTFQTESHLFFVMEYLNGGDLMFHIQQSGRFTEERARFYGAEIVSGLKFLHKRGVIYRDLKLDNILLDYEGHIRIADFGMCKLQIYLDRMADTFCGTPDYMSPEIIKGLRYNQCVDWWAFGVLMYEMLIGQSPFSGHDEDELFWSVCNEPVHYPRFLTKESKKLLELLLEKDASKRLGTVGCIHGDVKEQQFFQPIDWERLEKRDLEPPYKPKLKHSLDVQYFDTAFTKEAARLTPVDKEILRSMDQTQFEGFSYTNPHTTD